MKTNEFVSKLSSDITIVEKHRKLKKKINRLQDNVRYTSSYENKNMHMKSKYILYIQNQIDKQLPLDLTVRISLVASIALCSGCIGIESIALKVSSSHIRMQCPVLHANPAKLMPMR